MFFKKKQLTIQSPIAGEIVPLDQVEDPVFGGKMMGDGVAIMPKSGRVVAPVDGKIESIFPTKHALGIVASDGAEILIHVGINTVELEGKPYTLHVSAGEKVKKGDLLLEFDIAAITAAGYPVVTPVIITNTPDYKSIDVLASGSIAEKADLLQLSK